MLTRGQKAADTRKRNQERRAQLERCRAEAIALVSKGTCPHCGAGLKRNLAISGWWQCEQYGAEGFRKDSTKPACSGQWFTE